MIKYFIVLITVFVFLGCKQKQSFSEYINRCESEGGVLTICQPVSSDYVEQVCCVKEVKRLRDLIDEFTAENELMKFSVPVRSEFPSTAFAITGNSAEHIIHIEFSSGEVTVNEKYTSQQLAKEFLRAIPGLVEEIRAVPCDQGVRIEPLVK